MKRKLVAFLIITAMCANSTIAAFAEEPEGWYSIDASNSGITVINSTDTGTDDSNYEISCILSENGIILPNNTSISVIGMGTVTATIPDGQDSGSASNTNNKAVTLPDKIEVPDGNENVVEDIENNTEDVGKDIEDNTENVGEENTSSNTEDKKTLHLVQVHMRIMVKRMKTATQFWKGEILLMKI